MSKDLYKFDALKDFLKSEGINVGNAQGYVPVKPKDVFDKQGKTPICFQGEKGENGIFAADMNGVKHQVYMYKYRYYLNAENNYIPQSKKPRFHICQCITIQTFMNEGKFGEYYFANTDEVDVYDITTHRIVHLRDLPLCQNCARKMAKYSRAQKTSTFVEILKAAGEVPEQEIQETDIFGYVKDWEKISKAYRELHNYTCEKCGFDGSNAFERMYIHVHHRDGNKLNNNQANLQCLCIKCHSEVNDTHRKNFSEGDKKKQLNAFIKRKQQSLQINIENLHLYGDSNSIKSDGDMTINRIINNNSEIM